MIKIAIFASGSGTNAENIIRHFNQSKSSKIKVQILLSNTDKAFAIQRAIKLGITTYVFTKNELINGDVSNVLKKNKIDYIILAGFLIKIPETITNEFSNQIINIHPALLPSYGGKGMYGMNVHKAVIEAGEKESGITIHLVDENYDEGKHLFQTRCSIDKLDKPEDLAEKIHLLEQLHFPQVIEEFILRNL